MGTVSDACVRQVRTTVPVVLDLEFPTPKVVSKRAKTGTFGYRKYKENYNFR